MDGKLAVGLIGIAFLTGIVLTLLAISWIEKRQEEGIKNE